MSDGDKQGILQSVCEHLAAARRSASTSAHDAEAAQGLQSSLSAFSAAKSICGVDAEAAQGLQSSSSHNDREALLRRFADELTMLGADVLVARNADEAQAYIRDVVRRHHVQRVALSAAPILNSLAVEALLIEEGAEIISLPPEGQSDGLDQYKRQLMTADIGITGADAGLAESGTLVLRTGKAEGRLVSLLPPVHLAIIKADQLLPGVAEFILQSERPPSSSDVIFITGPSRTADIELTLTLGVHGPKQLHVLVLE
ncbi:MAG: lactate utilization protein [Blastocatellia bacterium]|nr:lactate utilization protein [Blastocatellia bacterium]